MSLGGRDGDLEGSREGFAILSASAGGMSGIEKSWETRRNSDIIIPSPDSMVLCENLHIEDAADESFSLFFWAWEMINEG